MMSLRSLTITFSPLREWNTSYLHDGSTFQLSVGPSWREGNPSYDAETAATARAYFGSKLWIILQIQVLFPWTYQCPTPTLLQRKKTSAHQRPISQITLKYPSISISTSTYFPIALLSWKIHKTKNCSHQQSRPRVLHDVRGLILKALNKAFYLL